MSRIEKDCWVQIALASAMQEANVATLQDHEQALSFVSQALKILAQYPVCPNMSWLDN